MFSPSKSSIKEANEHFQALYNRISELEKTVKDQAEAIIKRDDEEQQRMNAVTQKHQEEVTKLTTNLETAEKKIEILSRNLQEKSAVTTTLQYKCQIITDLCASIPAFESYLTTLKQIESLNSGECNHIGHGGAKRVLHNNIDSIELNNEDVEMDGQTTV
ncbi:vimentin-type intermediate filament-associated coiled-coil protein-like [Antedon mediterranea]|uniref:vimentin-type intermediate filament-associated coiled-coil protein-like n=1 Tax=Antedon mediterranea TaxID=105859 RepID=UPI003AF5ED8E